MAYSISVIDNGINQAAVENKIKTDGVLNSLCLKKLIKNKEAWAGEIPLLNLFKRLLDEKDNEDELLWKVYAFTHPEYFKIAFNEEMLRTEFIVFDWDYGVTTDQEEYLLNILESTYSLVFIFSGADKKNEILAILDGPDFKKFGNRCFFLDKNNDMGENSDSPSDLIKTAKAEREKNFSFRFGTELRRRSLEALDKILLELGKVHIDETVNYFKLNEDKDRDLIDFISERFRNYLIESPFSELPQDNKNAPAPNEEIAKKLWAYRLYFYNHDSSKDKYVRKGDIVEKDGEIFIVITPDCDLQRHWHKNFGYINLLPIYDIVENSVDIKKKTQTRKDKKVHANLKVSSFSTPMEPFGKGGPLALPFLKYKGEVRNFITFPKEMTCRKVDIKEDSVNKDTSLVYGANFDYERIATISEPFLTPFIQNVLNALAGFGTPDYTDTVKGIIADDLKRIFDGK